MSTESSTSTPLTTTTNRGRGRGSRGGLGKYLRARGRRGGGRPAEFRERLVLEDEQVLNDEEAEAEAAELATKFSRRKLGTNADRYAEPEPELGSDGEPIVEPEVDLSSFLQRQRISDDKSPSIIKDPQSQIDDDDVDHTLDHLPTTSRSSRQPVAPKKGKVETLEWDEEFENMAREKAAAEANWELKERFRAKTERLRGKAIASGAKSRKSMTNNVVEAPELPSSAPPKAEKAQLEDFLDDLLA